MAAKAITLSDVRDVAPVAEGLVAAFEGDFAAALASVEVPHIGATALSFGQTKGDVDVNIRVGASRFDSLVGALRERLAVAQPEDWTPTFASFSLEGYELPLGVQVTVIDSADDFLLAIRNRMRGDPTLLRRYNDLKVAAAAGGAEKYWEAKDALFRDLLAARDCL